MATLNELWNLRYETQTLRARVAAACAKAAWDILYEDPGTTNHANRLVWAADVWRDAPAMADRMLWGVCSNTAVQAGGEATTDVDVQNAVNGLIDMFATGA
jgi:hypothetical protein